MSGAVKAITSPVSKILGGGGGDAPAPAPAADPVTPVAARPDASESALLTREAKRRKAGSASGVAALGGAPQRGINVASRELLG